MTAKVFISSTGKDLAAYRQVAREVCEELGLVAIGMETFEAMDAGPTEGSKRKLDEADVYVGIFAHRYGYVEPGYDNSVTECEYEHAGVLRLERLCFLHDPTHAWLPQFYEVDGQKALEALKTRISASHIRAIFSTGDDFRHKLYRALESWKRRKAPVAAVTPSLIHQLQPPPADFTGREEALREILAAVEGDGVRGITIWGLRGMGGIGKTSLALVAADRLAPRYPDAQVVVDLRGTDPEPLSPEAAMAQVVQAFQPQVRPPDSPKMLVAAYRSALHRKRALLILDNASSAAQVEALLPPATCLCLVTSRRRFALPGQRTLDLDALPDTEACELLEKLVPGIEGEIAAQIASLCGRLPLALRLAGGALAQRPDLMAAEYAQRLREQSERLRLNDGSVSVEGSLALSWELLDEQDRANLAHLSVFPSGFDRAAAAAVWHRPEADASEALGRLLATCLLDWDREGKRYHLHDLTRDFAASRLGESEKHSAVRRHAVHYILVLLRVEELYKSGGERVMDGLALFDGERRNVEAAFSWARAQADSDEVAASLCNDYPGASARVLHLRLHPREQISWLTVGLAAARSLGDRKAEGRHNGNLGVCYLELGDPRLAIEFHEQHLEIAREMHDRQEEGNALANLGIAYAHLGDSRCIEFYEEALTITRETGDREGEANTLGNLGLAYFFRGEVRKAIEFHEQHLKLARERGDRQGESNALGNLGNACAALSEFPRAIEFYEKWLSTSRIIGDRRGEAKALGSLGLVSMNLGDPQQAIQFNKQSLTIAREIGDRWVEADSHWNLGRVYEKEGNLPRAIELMSDCVEFLCEVGHPDAAKHADYVEAIRRRFPP